jgi:xylan 1,4-beta-xylosidase
VAKSRGVSFASSGNFSYATSFPQPIVLGAAFDTPLVRAVATTVSTEARAFANAGRAGLNYWTPNINPLRDPRWGRGQEVPGEDALAVAEYVRALIPGLQGQEEDGDGAPDHVLARAGAAAAAAAAAEPKWKLVATCKHFAGYDIENWKGNKRYGFNAVISRADLQDYYLAPFRACVRDAGARSVMCSYNAVNGVPTCADPWLLQSVLRDQWGFSQDYDDSSANNNKSARWVTADCDALANVWTDHHYGRSAADAAAQSLNAGTDLDCGDFWPKNLAAAHDGKLFTDAALDRSLVRRYASLVRLGWFDAPGPQPQPGNPDRQIGWEAVGTAAASALALRAAVEGLVLLKNSNAALPLATGGGSSPTTAKKKIAVIGPLGSATTQMQGNYFGTAQRISSVASAFRDAGHSVTAVQGCDISGSGTSGFSTALAATRGADAVVFVGGMDTSVEAEDRDREQITWPGQQVALIKQLASAVQGSGGNANSSSKPPLVVVQMGTMVDSSALEAEKGVDALLWAGYPGQDGGKAIVNVLLGQNAPAGRLPVTQYPAAYVDQVKMTDMNLQPGNGNPGYVLAYRPPKVPLEP